jgi:hypothetical protein
VASWFKRVVPPVEVPRLTPRREQRAAERVDLGEIAPELVPYLAQAAYLQLEAFQTLSQIVSQLSELAAKQHVGNAAGLALAKHQGLVAELRRHGADPAEAMLPFAATIDRFRIVAAGADWQENLLGVYVTAGLLDDFFIRLAAGLPGDVGPRAAQLLGADSGAAMTVQILGAELAADPRLASRLALWGRRLVGDTLLVARSALHLASGATPEGQRDEQRVEPVFTEIIAAHTRRMDALGLTA